MSTTFLSRDDYPAKIDLAILDQITGSDSTILDDAEADAASCISDRIGHKYKVTAALAVTGESRNRTLVRWMLNIAVYYLYGRVPDLDIPERVVKDYDDTLADLDRIAAGKLPAPFDRVIDTTTGAVPTRLRLGSNSPRSHNPY